MKTNYSYSWCPQCKRWVPADSMNYDIDDNKVLRVCQFCLDDDISGQQYVLDEHYGEIQCLYCGSNNTEELIPTYGKFRCKQCNEIFWR